MNLSDDMCQWTGWEVIVRTTDYTVVCVLLRRQYLPPLLDTCQDIAIVFRISLEDQQECQLTDDDFLKEVYFAADSLSSISQQMVWYKDFVQAKLDALLMNEPGFKWLQLRQKAMPVFLPKARAFLKSILLLLLKDGLLEDMDLVHELGETVEVDEDPMRVALSMVKSGEGMNVIDDSDKQKSLINEWQMRVANYLGFCIDEVLLPGQFSLADITDAVGQAGPETDATIRRVLDFLIHIRPKDMTVPCTGGSLVALVEDSVAFQRDYIFNARILKVTLEIGYIARLFPKGSEDKFLMLMGVLLRSPASPVSLKTSVCRQILKATTSKTVAPDRLTPLVPSLVDLVRKKDSPSSSTYLASFAIASLVNLAGGHLPIKNMLVNMDVARMVVNIIKTKVVSARRLCRFAATLLPRVAAGGRMTTLRNIA
eukprot:GHVQ01038263.1.p1 GENE.GHVQ01038263.1~~GHVQ01038263.1.p1  ORF type:complete len:426 (+),score=32.55 GHVQ01038263.1:3374-4651(+)